MSISYKQVQEIARLARVSIDHADIPSYSEQLTKILNFMNEMQTIDTNEIEPLAHPIEEIGLLRSDAVIEIDERKDIQKCANDTVDNFYTVPRVID